LKTEISDQKIKTPRILIAGTTSGAGKTTIAMGLIAALRKRGYKVQPFKVGPDYIDPGYLNQAAGKICRNLDSWLIPKETLLKLFTKNAHESDIAVIEGVMGLYDGYKGRSEAGSTAEVAKLLRCPVLLVIDGHSLARSAGAVALGYRDFDSELDLAGVVFNRVNSEKHFQMLRTSVEGKGIPVLGYFKEDSGVKLVSRHLGLIPTGEQIKIKEILDRIVLKIEGRIDLNRIIEMAGQAPALRREIDLTPPQAKRRVRIAIAQDKAFSFYYQDNIELLQTYGAEIVFFSPLEDSQLPADVDGLYFGGGFPEIFAERLTHNEQMRKSIVSAVRSGMPTYAECGGLMYLTRSVIDFRGQQFEMVGVLPFICQLQRKLTLGYREVIFLQDTILAGKGEIVRGHEFHYSQINGYQENLFPAAYRVCNDSDQREGGFALKNLFASYLHLHFAGYPLLAERFVQSCQDWQEGKRR
jgi:cobyrinic acid a,c-diamide synthase